jgi:hypothetical protein
MEKISWTDRVRNEVLHIVKRRVISYKQQKERRLTGLVTSGVRNCLLKHVIEGKIEGGVGVRGRRRRRRKQLLDDRKERRGYWKLKKETLDGTVWRTRFGRGYGPVV